MVNHTHTHTMPFFFNEKSDLLPTIFRKTTHHLAYERTFSTNDTQNVIYCVFFFFGEGFESEVEKSTKSPSTEIMRT